jgi:hypothetical protein
MPEHAHPMFQKEQKFTGCSICGSDRVPPTEIAYHCKRKECHGLQACIACVKGTSGAEEAHLYGQERLCDRFGALGVEGELATAVVLRNEFDLHVLSHMVVPEKYRSAVDCLSRRFHTR